MKFANKATRLKTVPNEGISTAFISNEEFVCCQKQESFFFYSPVLQVFLEDQKTIVAILIPRSTLHKSDVM